ncbi:MAG: phage shock protein A [Dehalococcoidia bacterium]|nr:phage shock protein A [Dehalococcoidia bacterium]
MGIFTRFKDIVSSNINAVLDQAEDPEKMIRLMAQEMEDTLVEMKASCASAMANRTRLGRTLEDAKEKAKRWTEKAELAVGKGREDLAREALLEKRHHREQAKKLESDFSEMEGIIGQYQQDIAELEEKLEAIRDRYKVLAEKAIQAKKSKQAREQVREADGTSVFLRFEQMLHRVDRMVAEAELARARNSSLDKEFAELETDEELEIELEELKGKTAKQGEPA